MANKIDKVSKRDSVHLLLAIRRNKDNPTQTAKDETCYREIIVDEESEALTKLKARCSTKPGVWRIYHTVNSRDTKKAAKLVMHKLLDEFDEWHYRVDSLYKKMLLQTTCRYTKNFMLDVDSKDTEIVHDIAALEHTLLLDLHESPNGLHLIVKPFDKSKVKLPGQVTVLTDGYYFVEKFEVHGDTKKDTTI